MVIILSKTESLKEQSNIHKHISIVHPNLKIALTHAKKALLIAQKIQHLPLQADAHEEISIIQRELGNNEESLNSSFKALTIYQKLNIKDGICASYDQVAGNYLLNKDYNTAIIYYKKALTNAEKIKEEYKLGIFHNLGNAYREAGYLDSAMYQFRKILARNNLAKHTKIKGFAFGSIGMIYNRQNKIDSSILFLQKSINLLSKEDTHSSSIFTAELAKIHQKKKEYLEAEKKYHEALTLAQQDGLKEQIRDFNQLLSEFYTERKDYKKALHHQRQFQIYQDSLVNKENVRKIEQLKAGYEIDKRETQIGLLNKVNSTQKKWVYSLALGVLSFLVLATLLFFSRKKVRKANTVLAQQKEEISKREQEKAWLLRELNHRVKNNLQMVASLLNLQSNKLSGHPAQEAILIGKQRVEALSLVHRKLYQEGVDTRINIKDYITELILGLFHAYNANFKPDIKIGEQISVNIDSAIPLALIVNEIIINCLKYAYAGIENPELTVEINPLPDKHLSIHIFDNGIGFDENAEMKDSLGMKIIKSLTRQLEGSVSHFNDNGAHWQLSVLGK